MGLLCSAESCPICFLGFIESKAYSVIGHRRHIGSLLIFYLLFLIVSKKTTTWVAGSRDADQGTSEHLDFTRPTPALSKSLEWAPYSDLFSLNQVWILLNVG